MDKEFENFKETLALSLYVFYHRLNSLYETYYDRTEFLFLARAGITIKKHLELFRKYYFQSEKSVGDVIWINRNIVTNSVEDNDEYFSLIKNKFQNNEDIISMYENSFGLKINKKPKQISDKEIKVLIEKSQYIRKKSNLIIREFFSKFKNSNIMMVDSGWMGTTENYLIKFILKDFVEVNMTRINFGVLKQAFNVPACGIMFNYYDDFNDNPFKNFHFCRHLIEILFEISFPSPNQINLTDGELLPSNYKKNLSKVNNLKYKFALDVERKLIRLFKNKLQINEIKYEELYRDLKLFLRTPSYNISKHFSKIMISHDDGKKGEVSIIGEKNKNIVDLWPQANYAFFYNSDYAVGYQNIFNKSLNDVEITQDDKLPYVDVITRTMDRPFFLERALKSIKNQTYNNIKHIIVIDGADLTPVYNKINDTVDDPFNIKIINLKKNYGMEAASNCGIENSNSDYILIHDDDDTLEPEFISNCINFLISNNGLYKGVITYSKEIKEKIIGDEILKLSEKPYNGHLGGIFLHDILQENTFAPISFLFSRNVLKTIGLYNEGLPVLGDWDFNIRFLEKFEIGLIQQFLANYHIRDVSENLSFGNSINTGMSNHQKFQQIVRNDFFRRNPAYAMTSLAKFEGHKNYHRNKSLFDEYFNKNNNNNILLNTYYKIILMDVFPEIYLKNFDYFNKMDVLALKEYFQEFVNNPNKKINSIFFDEDRYIRFHKDIERALIDKKLNSSLQHFLMYGFFEKRTF